jgi:hypothetical protein
MIKIEILRKTQKRTVFRVDDKKFTMFKGGFGMTTEIFCSAINKVIPKSKYLEYGLTEAILKQVNLLISQFPTVGQEKPHRSHRVEW